MHLHFLWGFSGVEHRDEYQFAGTGMHDDEIKRVMSAQGKEAQIRELRVCRLRLVDEVHKKQQELDKLDYLIGSVLKEKA